ncbi:MAG: TonB-dependent receptor [Acidobacteriaceae bacterium]|nr:TonB-dependent receptor [Acidobacteriaceae bacterium]
MHFRCSLAFAVVVCTFLASPILGQESRGGIVGRVLDSSGAVIPNAIVNATDETTNVAIQTQTNEQGNYELLFLVPSRYRVSVEVAGFKTFQRVDLEVRSGDRVPLDITLELGTVTEKTVVSATTPLLETETANVGNVVDRRNAEELPTPYGNPRTLFMLMPGVNQGYPSGVKYQQATLPYISSYLSINGAPLGTTEMTLDGVPNMQTVNAAKEGISHQPPVDAVTEVKAETAYDASVGYTSGETLNLVLKSGTNQFHGSAYFFDRRPSFYANGFFANRAGQAIGSFYDLRTGITAGAPVYIPKIYHGANRTFFFYSFERYDEKLPLNPFTGTVPTPAERRGDFSALLNVGPQYQIYDPSTIAPAGGGRFSRAPFTNNIIPPSRIDPIAAALTNLYPLPNAPGTPDGTNNYVNQNNTDPTVYYDQTLRLDHIISEHFRISGHYVHSHKTEGPYNDYFQNAASGAYFYSGPTSLLFDAVWTPSATWVVDANYGYNRHPVQGNAKTTSVDLTSLGFPASLVKQLSFRSPLAEGFPTVNVAGLATINPYSALVYTNDIHAFNIGVSHPFASHYFQFGFDARLYRDDRYSFGSATPTFTFNPVYTNGPLDNSATSPSGVGQGYASLLLGIPTSGQVDYNDSLAAQSPLWGTYIQDNWRVTPKLVLTLGLRYEYEIPLTERYNRSVRGFDPNAPLAVTAAAQSNYAANPIPEVPPSSFNARGGLLFAGVNGQPRELWNADARKFMPRVGFAYTAWQNTVIRAGYGIYYLPIGEPFGTLPQQLGYNQSTFIVPTINNGQTFTASLANPFPSGILLPPGNSLGPNTYLGNNIAFFNTNLESAYNQRWNISIERLLPQKILLEIAYAGSRVVRLPISRDLNALPDKYLSTLPYRDQTLINRLTAQVPNPFYPSLPGTTLAAQTVPVQQLLKPFPQFGSMTVLTNQGYSWYHALQVRAERRFSQGYSLLGAYNYSKLMEAVTYLNPGDAMPYRSISPYDRRHHLVLSGIYEFPVGAGRMFVSHPAPVIKQLISGWQTEWTWQLYSGEPLGFGNVFFNGDATKIQLPSDQRSVDEWFNVNAGFVRSAAAQPLFNLRTAPLYYAGLRAPIYNNWDAGLIKNTPIFESLNLQFRAEAFNVFNHPSFAAPNTVVTSQAFGTITAENSNPRQLQLALRIRW